MTFDEWWLPRRLSPKSLNASTAFYERMWEFLGKPYYEKWEE